MLQFNIRHNIQFFRITSDLVPFASHPICKFNWQEHFKSKFREIGNIIENYDMRISMHPDQFTMINSIDGTVLANSLRELSYHSEVLDLMRLDTSAKIQIHVGGVYGDKEKSIKRFVQRFAELDEIITGRLVIENDDNLYNLRDCLKINVDTDVPVLFDVFHHKVNNSGETIEKAFELFTKTWKEKDGIAMVDYSASRPSSLRRKHAESIDLKRFRNFLERTRLFDFDIMQEIKDKETSAIKAVRVASDDNRFQETHPMKMTPTKILESKLH